MFILILLKLDLYNTLRLRRFTAILLKINFVKTNYTLFGLNVKMTLLHKIRCIHSEINYT